MFYLFGCFLKAGYGVLCSFLFDVSSSSSLTVWPSSRYIGWVTVAAVAVCDIAIVSLVYGVQVKTPAG